MLLARSSCADAMHGHAASQGPSLLMLDGYNGIDAPGSAEVASRAAGPRGRGAWHISDLVDRLMQVDRQGVASVVAGCC